MLDLARVRAGLPLDQDDVIERTAASPALPTAPGNDHHVDPDEDPVRWSVIVFDGGAIWSPLRILDQCFVTETT